MKEEILLLDGTEIPQEAINLLNKIGNVQSVNLNKFEDRNLIKALVIDKTILWVALGHMIDSDLLQNATMLKHVVTTTTGHDHIDEAFLEKKGIKLHSLRGDDVFLNSLHATAELAWGLLLSSARDIINASNDVKNGNWQRELFKGIEISGKTLGIIGLGRLGTKVATYGKAFNMKVIAYDIDHNRKINGVDVFNNIDPVFEASDFLSLHIHMNDKNKHLIDEKKLNLMKPTATIVNTSRGGIVDEDAVARRLVTNKLRAYAADVVSNEQNNNSSKLRILFESGFPRITLTPHIGGLTKDSRDKAEIHMAKKLHSRIIIGEA
jgi:D-3-phosphoglycerate dehydrogenase